MLENELKRAMDETGCTYPVVLLPRTLHSTPSILNMKINEELSQLPDYVDRVLFAFGYCGGAFVGLESNNRELIMPLVSDCIDIWLNQSDGSHRRIDTMYFTPKWTKDQKFIGKEFLLMIDKYGLVKATQLYRRYLKNYKNLNFLNTQSSDSEETESAIEMVRELSQSLDLGFLCQQGSISLLKKLLTGPWDDSFLIIPPKTTFSLNLYYKKMKSYRSTTP